MRACDLDVVARSAERGMGGTLYEHDIISLKEQVHHKHVKE